MSSSADRAGAKMDLRAMAASRLAPYKQPKAYFATGELRHTATRKLSRRGLPEHLRLGRVK